MSKRTSLAFAVVATLALAACQDSPTGSTVENPRPLRGPQLTVAYTSVFTFSLNPTIDNVTKVLLDHGWLLKVEGRHRVRGTMRGEVYTVRREYFDRGEG
jgi:uncharacterized lipoprotein YajG